MSHPKSRRYKWMLASLLAVSFCLPTGHVLAADAKDALNTPYEKAASTQEKPASPLSEDSFSMESRDEDDREVLPTESISPESVEQPAADQDIKESDAAQPVWSVQERNGTLYILDEQGQPASSTWVQIDGKDYFAAADGSLYRNQVISFGSRLYYMGNDGYRLTGLIQTPNENYLADSTTGLLRTDNRFVEYQGSLYFPKPNGQLYREQQLSFGKTVYYVDETGARAHGFINTQDGLRYYSEKNDQLFRGPSWLTINGQRYFAREDGRLYTNQMISFGRTSYLLDAQGRVRQGLVEYNGNLYLAAGPGDSIRKDNAWVNYNGQQYFPNAQGILYRNQLISFGSTSYGLNERGEKLFGTAAIKNIPYRFNEKTGALLRKAGWYTWNGGRYFAKADGQPYTNQLISFGKKEAYYMNAQGRAVQEGIVRYHSYLYFADPEQQGNLYTKSGFFNYQGNTYYALNNHSLHRGWLSFGRTYYFFHNDGTQRFGKPVDHNGILYQLDEKGIRENKSGFETINGKSYYFNPRSGFPVEGWFTVDGKTYYGGNRGILLKGLQTVNGRLYYFDLRTTWPAMVCNEKLSFGSKRYQFGSDGVGKDITYQESLGERIRYSGGTLYVYNNYGSVEKSRYVGDDHIVISLSNQYMWIFRNGRLRFSTPVITGKTSTPTVVGNFNIYMRTRNTTLRGADYASDVDYWMPFYGGYGIHDAPWQPRGAYYYNSSWYRQNGSHGCINTPPSAMPTVWSLSFVGMPVTVVR